MRLIKSSNEIDLLRRACGVSAVGHRRLMETLVPGRFEFQAEAILEYEFRSGGCTGPAYGTIVAGGESASVLHYTANDKILRDGELVLVDAGGEYGGYCADITRTFPVGPRYSTAQAEAYDIVLDAQTKAIDVVRPGSRYSDVHDAAVRALSEGLIALGVISGSADECIENEAYKPYFMHRTSHWLGMDVHDVGSYRDAAESRRLLPGIVLTVEPGLYFRADADVPSHLRGVGIRIEDDVAVTETGCDVLSSEVPKRRNEIEALRDRVSG
jgi:Xaa-Pro aminopeptidase